MALHALSEFFLIPAILFARTSATGAPTAVPNADPTIAALVTPSEPHSFKRLVLGLQPSTPERIFRLAAELAEPLDLELLGLFLDDPSVRDLAEIPFARELRPTDSGWHAFDLERLARDADYAAPNIERMFAAAAKYLATRYQFEIIRGPLGVQCCCRSHAVAIS